MSRVYRDTVINKVCENLPCDNESLLNIKGLKADKVKPYADEIVRIVNNYCKENKLNRERLTRVKI